MTEDVEVEVEVEVEVGHNREEVKYKDCLHNIVVLELVIRT